MGRHGPWGRRAWAGCLPCRVSQTAGACKARPILRRADETRIEHRFGEIEQVERCHTQDPRQLRGRTGTLRKSIKQTLGVGCNRCGASGRARVDVNCAERCQLREGCVMVDDHQCGGGALCKDPGAAGAARPGEHDETAPSRCIDGDLLADGSARKGTGQSGMHATLRTVGDHQSRCASIHRRHEHPSEQTPVARDCRVHGHGRSRRRRPQRLCQAGAGRPARRPTVEHATDQFIKGVRNIVAEHRGAQRQLVARRQGLGRTLRREGSPTRERPDNEGAEREDVGRGCRGCAAELLRRGRAECSVEAAGAGWTDGQSQIDQAGRIPGPHHDVLGLHVSMRMPGIVQRHERVGESGDCLDHLHDGPTLRPVRERGTGQQPECEPLATLVVINDLREATARQGPKQTRLPHQPWSMLRQARALQGDGATRPDSDIHLHVRAAAEAAQRLVGAGGRVGHRMDATPCTSARASWVPEEGMDVFRKLAAVGLGVGFGPCLRDAHADGPPEPVMTDAAQAVAAAFPVPDITDLVKCCRKGPRTGARGGDQKRKQKQDGWVSRPYVRPLAGVSVWGGSGRRTTSIATAGAEAGIIFRQVGRPLPRWRVNPRARGQLSSTSSGIAGFHARAGVQAGPWWKHVGLSFGPDLYRDQLLTDRVTLDPVTGMAVPMMGHGRLGPFGLQAGVEPSWFLSGDRPGVDWADTDAFGFGDEFAYLAGASAKVQQMVLGVRWTRRITAMGEGTDWSFNAGFRL